MFPRLLITGWKRGGLGYVCESLKAAGFDVGTTFTDVTTESSVQERIADAKEIEVSSNIVPFLAMDCFNESEKFFALRDPMRVVNSLMFLGQLHNEKPSNLYTLMSSQDRFDEYRKRPEALVCYYVYFWFLLFCDKTVGTPNFFKVENGSNIILRKLGLKADSKFFAKKVNASNCKQLLTPASIPAEFKETIVSLLRETGYRGPVWLPRNNQQHFISSDLHRNA